MPDSELNPQLRDALARLIEGEAEPADEERITEALRTDPALLAVLRDQLRLDALLCQEATGDADEFVDSVRERIRATADASAFEQRVSAALTPRPTAAKRGGWRLLAGAMAVLLLGLGAWWSFSRPEKAVVTLHQVAGVVSWSSERGDWRSALVNGAQLADGTLSVDGEMSSAVLAFQDGTRVTLTGSAELTFSDSGQKRLRCARGSLSANVTPQPPGRPMLVRTPTAEIEVLGTLFTIEAEAAATTISVERGSVRVRRIDDDSSADLTAEQVMIVTSETQFPLAPRSAPSARSQWRALLEPPLDERWSGAWLPADASGPKRIMAVLLPVGAKRKFLKPGVKIALCEVEGVAGSIAIHPRSTLRLRVRLPESDELDVFISTSTGGGGFAGNFQRILPVGGGTIAGDGWVTFELALGQLPPVPAFRDEYPSAQGARMKLLLLTATASFEVAAVEIFER